MYKACYQELSNKRKYKLDKWKKSNPYKCKNMRLYASILDPDCEIISSDEELQDADNIKTKFRCPRCGRIYEKRWYHWIAQPKGKHLCQKCSASNRAKLKALTYDELASLYAEKGLHLISDYQYYLNNGGVYVRMHCEDAEGYKYTANVYSVKEWKTGEDVKYSMTNPYAVENLQHKCNVDNINLKILSIEKDSHGKTEAVVKCSCGNIFKARPFLIANKIKIRCGECISKESNLEKLTREWLEENNIPFEREYRFEDCRYKRPLPFDFKIEWKDKIILIEVDGAQHYHTTQWTNEESLAAQKIKDGIKTNYCLKHGYSLLRLPFWWFDTDKYKKELNKTFFG